MKSKAILMPITLILLIISHISAKKYTYSACDPSSALNSANLACSPCPTNSIANNYQAVATSCQCAAGFLRSGSGACSLGSVSTCGSASNNFYPFYLISGDMNSAATTCTPCGLTAFTNMYPASHEAMQLHAPPVGKE